MPKFKVGDHISSMLIDLIVEGVDDVIMTYTLRKSNSVLTFVENIRDIDHQYTLVMSSPPPSPTPKFQVGDTIEQTPGDLWVVSQVDIQNNLYDLKAVSGSASVVQLIPTVDQLYTRASAYSIVNSYWANPPPSTATDSIVLGGGSNQLTLDQYCSVGGGGSGGRSGGLSLAEEWKKEGKCPQCGELGHYHHCVPVCKTHGPY